MQNPPEQPERPEHLEQPERLERPVETTRTEKGTAPEPAVPFLHVRDAVVRRAGRPILAIDDFRLAEGENVVLLGPNGSGKSTFVKLITREVMPLYREHPPVMFRGDPRPVLADVRRVLGVVSASMQAEISVHLPVRDIVAGGLTGTLGLPFHVPADEAARAREAGRAPLALLNIADLADRDVMTLSTGQARRVLIARALVSEPEVLVFDEPSTGLDPQGMFHVRRAMRTLAQRGTGIVLVTHYPEDVIPEISRVVLMKEGRIFADGQTGELLRDGPMSRLFDVPLAVRHEAGIYSLVPAT